MKLFITRPEADGVKTSELLKNLGHSVLIVPILEIEFLENTKIAKAGALIFTSKNGVRSTKNLDINKETPIFTVGDQTANEVKNLGFKRVFSANGSQKDLLNLILLHSTTVKGGFVHLSGEHVKGDLVGSLISKNIKAERQITYKANAFKEMPNELIEAIKSKKFDGGVFYSRRSATTFKDMVDKHHLIEDIKCLTAFVLSEDVKASFKDEDWKNIILPPSPNEKSLLKQIENFCSN